MQERGELDPTEPFMMSGFFKQDAKHIFDSDFDYTGLPRRKLNRMMLQAGVEGGPHHHLNVSGVMFGKSSSSFVGFASILLTGRATIGRARLDIGTPCLGRLGELPFGWSALSDYCEGMMLEDLYDELTTTFQNGGHVLRTRQQVEQEIDYLQASGYEPLRAFDGGKDAWLMAAVVPHGVV